MQILSDKEFLGKPKDSRGNENKDTKGIWCLWHLQLEKNIKNSTTPRQINTKPHTEDLFMSTPFT